MGPSVKFRWPPFLKKVLNGFIFLEEERADNQPVDPKRTGIEED
jgi:hypothetical protein